jgi:surface polysaccharide O-acyltransferase-like enzyme
MNTSASISLVLLAALLAANLPFINQRWLGVLPRSAPKTLPIHLLELVVCYFLVGALGLAFEKADGQIYPQGWEFYVTTAALFLTLAFPGFVYRYLYKRHG